MPVTWFCKMSATDSSLSFFTLCLICSSFFSRISRISFHHFQLKKMWFKTCVTKQPSTTHFSTHCPFSLLLLHHHDDDDVDDALTFNLTEEELPPSSSFPHHSAGRKGKKEYEKIEDDEMSEVWQEGKIDVKRYKIHVHFFLDVK